MPAFLDKISARKTPPAAARPAPPSQVRVSRRERYARRIEGHHAVLCYCGLGAGAFLLAAVLGLVLFHRSPEEKAWQRMLESARRRGAEVVGATPEALATSAPRRRITFAELSAFEFVVTPDISAAKMEAELSTGWLGMKVPDAVRALNGHAVELEGFMVPLRVERGVTHEWLLVRDRALCCYGKMPRMNEWVRVRSRRGVKVMLDRVVSCRGRFTVGEMREGGLLTGIYQLDAEEVRPTKE